MTPQRMRHGRGEQTQPPLLSEEVTPDLREHPPSCARRPQLNADQHGKEKPPCSPCAQPGDTATLSGHQPPQSHSLLLSPSCALFPPHGLQSPALKGVLGEIRGFGVKDSRDARGPKPTFIITGEQNPSAGCKPPANPSSQILLKI